MQRSGFIAMTIFRDHSAELVISKIMNSRERSLLVLAFGQPKLANGSEIRMIGTERKTKIKNLFCCLTGNAKLGQKAE